MKTASSWIVRRPGLHPRLRLFCFCYAGGSAAAYLPWQSMLPSWVEVCGVQLPGRGTRFSEPPPTSLFATVQAISDALTDWHDLPFAFFGHSLGATLAFEVAHHQSRYGRPLPTQLILSGAQAPSARSDSRNLHLLDDADLIAELRKYDGTPSEVLSNHELMELVLPAIRADFRIVETYAPLQRPPLAIPMSVLAGRDDRHSCASQYEAWFKETTRPMSLEWFDGGHFFIHSASKRVLDHIQSLLSVPRVQ